MFNAIGPTGGLERRNGVEIQGWGGGRSLLRKLVDFEHSLH